MVMLKRLFTFALDPSSGVPVYRQLVDQVAGGLAAGRLREGDQLPTVRSTAVDLAINPNTVIRAYKELELRGMIETQQGLGTFISAQKIKGGDSERRRQLSQMVGELVAKAGAAGFTINDIVGELKDR